MRKNQQGKRGSECTRCEVVQALASLNASPHASGSLPSLLDPAFPPHLLKALRGDPDNVDYLSGPVALPDPIPDVARAQNVRAFLAQVPLHLWVGTWEGAGAGPRAAGAAAHAALVLPLLRGRPAGSTTSVGRIRPRRASCAAATTPASRSACGSHLSHSITS